MYRMVHCTDWYIHTGRHRKVGPVHQHIIEERAWSSADSHTIYGLLADGATWPVWSGIDSFVLLEKGPDAPEGIGAVRLFRTGRTKSVERIVELVPDTRFGYALLSGLPLRDYRATVDLTPTAHGTLITWRSRFVAKVPGTGWIFQRALGRFIRSCVRQLADHAAETKERFAGFAQEQPAPNP